MQVPEKPSLDGLEAKWGEWWEASGTYRFDRTKTREQIYAIDTPPPTVSGSLHLGHMLEHTEIDAVVRWRRMSGDNVLWLPGTDHAGIATQLVVERELARHGLDRRTLGLGLFDKMDDARERGIAMVASHRHVQRAGAVDAAGKNFVAW